jgi:hypothetical protein
MSAGRLYKVILLVTAAGYLWLFIHYLFPESLQRSVCIFRFISGVPCPSCGTTRSVVSLFQGHFMLALKFNPLGIILSFAMVIIPVWIIFDITRGKKSFFNYYTRFEIILKRKPVAAVLIAAIIVLWGYVLFSLTPLG